mgnify:CR=1 FL=1
MRSIDFGLRLLKQYLREKQVELDADLAAADSAADASSSTTAATTVGVSLAHFNTALAVMSQDQLGGGDDDASNEAAALQSERDDSEVPRDF